LNNEYENLNKILRLVFVCWFKRSQDISKLMPYTLKLEIPISANYSYSRIESDE